MKRLFLLLSILTFIFIISCANPLNTDDKGKNDPANMDPAQVFDQETTDRLISEIRNKVISVDKTDPNFSSDSSNLTRASNFGTYPTRKGQIIITHDAYSGLLPTGHAAIVYSSSYVVESVSKGVVKGNNNWKSTKKSIAAGSVKSTTTTQDAKVADWCYKQKGKPYNYNFFDIGNRSKFYCSQLVWAGFKDLYSIDLNTSAYSVPLLGNPIHPTELLNNNVTYVSYNYNW